LETVRLGRWKERLFMARILRSTAFVLVLFLAAGSAQALPWSVSPAVESGSGFVSSAWQWLASWFAPADGLEASWDKAGGDMDPHGLDEGGDMDPHGGGSASVDGDEGSDMDPHG
jgi:hypothetical protein